MKEQLIKLAEEKGFFQDFTAMQISYGHLDIDYLWMCELQKWLRDKHNIDIIFEPERYKNGINYCVQAQCFDLINGDSKLNFIINATYMFNDNHEYPTYEQALEKGLSEALKLIK